MRCAHFSHNTLQLASGCAARIFRTTHYTFCAAALREHMTREDEGSGNPTHSLSKTEGIHMKPDTDEPEALLPLTPAAFHILLALTGGERHGYGIMQETTHNSEGKINLGAGTLYRTIRRLLNDGLIEESEERPAPDLDDER